MLPRISYVNGRYVSHRKAAVHIEDRGYQFADGIYEVMLVQNGVLLDGDAHFERLRRSLGELEIKEPASIPAIKIIIGELMRILDRRDGTLYIQVTRGVSPRNHPFPKNTKPSLVIALYGAKGHPAGEYENGVKCITHPDLRWGRCDIKSVGLLPNIIAKEQAIRAKAKEAWLINNDGFFTEGSSSNCYIVNDKGVLLTHPESNNILGGVTRSVVLNLARNNDIRVKEEPFCLADLKSASEAFLTSTTMGVMPVAEIDDIKIGKPGKVTQKLIDLYKAHVKNEVVDD